MWDNVALRYLLHILYALAVVLQALLLASKDGLKRLKHFAQKAIGGADTDARLFTVIPKHLAVVFVSEDLINYAHLADLVKLSVEHGIKRVSFYDPFSILYRAEERAEVREYVRARQRNGLIGDSTVLFDGDDDESGSARDVQTIRVSVLGPRHGRESIVRACRKLCHSCSALTPAAVQEYLEEEEGLFDPDFLVKIGPCYATLAGYSPWSLRTTEFHDTAGFSSAERVTREEFTELLCKYASRERRKGA